MGNVKKMVEDAETIANNVLDTGGDYVDALDGVFDFIWSILEIEPDEGGSERDNAWEMAKSIVISVSKNKGEINDR